MYLSACSCIANMLICLVQISLLSLMLNRNSMLRVMVELSRYVRTRKQICSTQLARYSNYPKIESAFLPQHLSSTLPLSRTSIMSLQDVFEPKAILAILKNLEKTPSAKETFVKTWKANVRSIYSILNIKLTLYTFLYQVDKRLESWRNHKDNKSTSKEQLQWEAEVIEYVDYLHSKLTVHKNTSPKTKDIPRTLDKSVPLLGPRFGPPTFLHHMRRDVTPLIEPKCAYISALTVVHPVFYPTTFTACPQCNSSEFRWDGWNGTGAQNVHGVRMNERAIGYQLRCKDCKASKATAGYCFVTTNHVFWEKWEHWKIPSKLFNHYRFRNK